jgi:8-oxo-dGTP pyrophosphatase MutT (NUDIX family)
MPLRPDLVATWVFRAPETDPDAVEILLIRRAPGRLLPGLWQCVTGKLETGETILEGALREVAEETGLGPEDLVALYDLNLVNLFHEVTLDAVLAEATFAMRVRLDAAPRLSEEHDALRWSAPDDALRLAVWPAYRESIARIRDVLADPDRARWMELTLDGRHAIH